jgi:hypothetical protein
MAASRDHSFQKSTHRLLPWAVIGFVMNLVSGFLFFMGDPGRYSINIGFQIKMVLVLVAGLNVLIFALAWVSLAAWTGVLLLGRLIPYIGTG